MPGGVIGPKRTVELHHDASKTCLERGYEITR